MAFFRDGRSAAGPNGLLVSALLALGASGIGCQPPTTTDGLEPPTQNPPATAPAAIRPISGDSQSAVAGALLPESLVVRIYDSLGDPFPGIAVDWSLDQAGELGAAQTMTDATGTAKNSWQLGSTPGYQYAVASSAALAPVTFVGRALITLQSIAISPQVVSLLIGGTQQYSTVGNYSDGSTKAVNVTYTATGGTIDAQGLYNAGNAAGTFIVVATASHGIVDTATVNLSVQTSVLTKIDLNPASVTLDRGVAQQFSVVGHMSDGSTIVPQVSYNATGGTITAGGLYTSGNSAGTFRVIAVQSGGTLADTAKVVVVAPPPGGGGNLANMTFETGGFEGLTDGGGGAPVNGKVLTGDAYGGTHLFDVNIAASGNDNAGYGWWVGTQTYADLWVSFALKVITSPNQGLATQKMVIFRNTGNAPNQFGEMNEIGGQWIWNWLFTDAGKGNIYLTNKFGTVAAGLGQWHTYKLHLQSHGTTTVTFGKDGVDNLITLTTTAKPAGIPTTMTFGGTLNAGSGPSHFQFDNIHIGTVDPGWP